MQRLTSFERESLSSWRAEMALYAQGHLTAASREHLRWLLERTMETEVTVRLSWPTSAPLLDLRGLQIRR